MTEAVQVFRELHYIIQSMRSSGIIDLCLVFNKPSALHFGILKITRQHGFSFYERK